LNRDIGACAGFIFHDNGLPKPLREPGRHDARDDVGAAPGWKAYDPTQWLYRVSLRNRCARNERENARSNRGDLQKSAPMSVHDGSLLQHATW
jgi:hypothetical protein